MFGINAGKQCVAMSIYAIVYNEIKSVNIWDTSLNMNIRRPTKFPAFGGRLPHFGVINLPDNLKKLL
jgi:hypothetical protein